MRYIKKITEYQDSYDQDGNPVSSVPASRVIEYQGYQMGDGWMAEHGWIGYSGSLPVSRLDIDAGTVTELPEPEPTEEWVEKSTFVDAVTALIPEEQRQSAAIRWQTIWGIAQLPGDTVNLRDDRVPEFLAGLGLSVEAVRTRLSA